VLVGVPAVLALRNRRLTPAWRYFLWLFAAVNLLTAFGYLLYSGIGGVGDWFRVVQGAEPAIVYRGAMTVVGALLYFVVAPKVLMPPLDPFLGRDRATRAARARTLCLYPYLAGGITFVAAGLLNPVGLEIVFISAVAASFGGTSLLAWYPGIPRKPSPETPEVPLAIERSKAWIAAAAVALILFVGVLGRGIGHL